MKDNHVKPFEFNEINIVPPNTKISKEACKPKQSKKKTPDLAVQKSKDVKNKAKAKILLIDDEQAFTKSLSRFLRSNGYDPYTLNNPELAMPAILKIQPDLIMLDIKMPKVSGGQIAGKIATHPETKKLPVIMLSGLISAHSSNKKDSDIHHSYMAKTAEPNEWIKEIERLLTLCSSEEI